MKSLVTEDDATIVELLQIILMPFGPSEGACDGVEALRAFEKALEIHDPYDVILLDIGIPLLDGYEVIEQIRKIESERRINPVNRVKIFIISGLADMENAPASLDGSWDGYITKPFKCQNVLEAIAKVMPLPDVYL
jgi:two-component system chemotaxis response regulator CheY